MASLQGNTIKDTYKSLLKVADNGELEAAAQEITDGNGNGTGVSLNTSGDVTATGTVSFGSLKDTGENITITKFVDAADGIGNNDNDGSIPTSAAVKSYVDTNVTAQDLDITDGTNNGSVDLDSQSLTFTGDAGVTATVSGQTLTLNSSALQAQITSNDSDIAGLDTRLTTAESNISSNDTDITALQTADTTLQSNIDTEASTRASADTTLQTNIDNEEAARIAADSALQTQITSNDTDITALQAADTTLQSNIDAEATARASADTTLQSNIDAEATARASADTALQSQITSNDTDISNLQSSKQDISEKGQANGYAPLDSGAKIPIANIPDSIVGQVEYQGTWDASTDTPTLPAASTVKGHYYVVSVGGTYLTITYAVGDWIISNGTDWEKVDNTDAVTSVFGRLGNVVANESDYSSFYPLISDLNTTNSNVSALDTRLTTAEGDIVAIETKTDNITVTQPVNLDTIESDTAANTTKLATIETGAQVNTVDSVNTQTGAVVLDADDIDDTLTTNKFTTQAEIDKLAGIEALADVTDAANVAAAGALMSGTAALSDLVDVSSATPNDGQVLTYDTVNGWQPEDSQGGGTDYTVQEISTNTTAVKDTLYVLTASLTLTLPASPATGDKVAVSNMSNTITPVVARNGNLIVGLAEDLTIDVKNISVEFIYSGATEGWIIFTDSILGYASVDTISGSGTTNYISKWSATDTLADSIIFDNGTNVGIGTSSPTAKLDVVGNITSQTQAIIGNGTNTFTTYNVGGTNIGFIGDANWTFGGSTSDLSIRGTNNIIFGVGFTEDMRLDSSGNLAFINGGGIDFSATGGAAGRTSNLLDDYEEGTWTPVIAFGGASVGVTYNADTRGTYTKIGRKVTVTAFVVLTSKGSSVGAATITGLPFASGATSGFFAAGSLHLNKISFEGFPNIYILNNVTTLNFGEITNAGVGGLIDNNNFANDSVCIATITYLTA